MVEIWDWFFANQLQYWMGSWALFLLAPVAWLAAQGGRWKKVLKQWWGTILMYYAVIVAPITFIYLVLAAILVSVSV